MRTWMHTHPGIAMIICFALGAHTGHVADHAHGIAQVILVVEAVSWMLWACYWYNET